MAPALCTRGVARFAAQSCAGLPEVEADVTEERLRQSLRLLVVALTLAEERLAHWPAQLEQKVFAQPAVV